MKPQLIPERRCLSTTPDTTTLRYGFSAEPETNRLDHCARSQPEGALSSRSLHVMQDSPVPMRS